MDPYYFSDYKFTKKVKPTKMSDNVTRRQYSPAVVVEKDEFFPFKIEPYPKSLLRKSVKGGGNNYLFINVSSPLGWAHAVPAPYSHHVLKRGSSGFSFSSYFANSNNRRSHILLFLFLFFLTCVFILAYSLYDSSYHYSFLV